jgi:hypothetical protein
MPAWKSPVATEAGNLAAFWQEIRLPACATTTASCAELDVLVEAASGARRTGSRMMGGGFGGRTINPGSEHVDGFIASVSAAHQKAAPICSQNPPDHH